MSLLSFFLGEKKKTADIAKERLKFLLVHERTDQGDCADPDYLHAMERELIEVIRKYVESKHVKIGPKDITVERQKQGGLEVLEVKIELPEKKQAA
jgi:cell division topological specificity factor